MRIGKQVWVSLLWVLTACSEPVTAVAVQPEKTTPYPASYEQPAIQQGTVTEVTYDTRDYVSANGGARQNRLSVYLPYGYSDSKPYNILYLVHGHYGNHSTFLTFSDSLLVHVLDNMIAAGDIDPLIVVTPTYNYGAPTSDYVDADPYCEALCSELINDIMPLVESRYNSYALTADAEGLEASRTHRAIGGFSMGGVTTWYALEHLLPQFKYFLPISGDCWSLGVFAGMNRPAATAQYLADIINATSYTGTGFYIWAASGTGDSAYRETLNQIEGMAELSDTFSGSNLSFHEKDGARHDYRPCVEYLYNALPFFFPPSTDTALESVYAPDVANTYNILGQRVSSGYRGIIIQNKQKQLIL